MASFPMANPIDSVGADPVKGFMGGSGFAPGGPAQPGSNQFFQNMPSIPSHGGGNPSGFNFGPEPTAGGPAFPTAHQNAAVPTAASNPFQVPTVAPQLTSVGPGVNSNQSIPGAHGVENQFPGLSTMFAQWIQNQIGQGVTPFNLGTPLPTGGSTQPGQLTAGMNPLLQQLMTMLSGGNTSIPGGNALNTIANQGISALPEWQSMIAAMQDPIAQQTANLREQFGSMGALAGSPFANAMSNFGQQTALQQESLLGQLQQQNILQGQIPVAEGFQNLQSQTSQYLQGLDQQAIQNQYSEFLRVQPQYNPLIQDMLSLTQQYPPTVQGPSGMGSLGALLSGIGALAGGISKLPGMGSKSSGGNG